MILALKLLQEGVWGDSVIEWVSVISIIALLASALTALYRHWRATECHIDGCKKHQWKEHVEPDGTKLMLCRKHHPMGSESITHQQVLAGHRENQRLAN